MKRFKREVITKEITEDNRFNYNQASFNSDGCIVLRNYNNNKDDEVIILNRGETNAILNLFSTIGCIEKRYKLPF